MPVNDGLQQLESLPLDIRSPGREDPEFTTAEFSFGDVSAMAGPGFDNVVALRGVNYNFEGGGNWMGMDYHALEVNDIETPPGGVPDAGRTAFLSLLALGGLGLLRRFIK